MVSSGVPNFVERGYGAAAFLLLVVLTLFIIARTIGGVGLLSAETIYPSLLSDTYPGAATPQVFTFYLFGVSGLSLLGASSWAPSLFNGLILVAAAGLASVFARRRGGGPRML